MGFDALRSTARQQRHDEADAQGGPRIDDLGRERLEPAEEHRLLAAPLHGGYGELDEVRRAVEVLAGQSVPDRLRRLAALLVPAARPSMQLGNQLRLLIDQTGPQHVREQVVVAVPPAVVVERDQEEVPPVEGLQGRLPALLPGNGITQRTGEPVQDGGLDQERLDLVGLTLQDLLGQVVDDIAIVSREPGDEACHVLALLHGERRELERGDPALGALLECGNVVCQQVQVHRAVEVGGGLLLGEPEVGRADLDEVSTSTESGQRQWWVGARGDRQVHVGRQVIEQERDPLVHLWGLDHVVVVEHQQQAAASGGELVEQGRQDRLDRRSLRGLEEGELVGTDARLHGLQSGDHIGPERLRVVVASVE